MAVDLFSQPTPTLGSIFEQKLVVGIGNIAVSNNPSHVLSTYALGSCVGVVAFDPSRTIGALIHIMLPEASERLGAAPDQPCKYANLAMPFLMGQLQRFQANPNQTRFFLAGGAKVTNIAVGVAIGQRNADFSRQYLRSSGFRLLGEDCGGNENRSLHLHLSTGTLHIQSPSGRKAISMRA